MRPAGAGTFVTRRTAVVAAAVVLAAAAAAVLIVERPDGRRPDGLERARQPSTLLPDVASELGVSPAELEEAVAKVVEVRLAAALASGRITERQAATIRRRLEEGRLDALARLQRLERNDQRRRRDR